MTSLARPAKSRLEPRLRSLTSRMRTTRRWFCMAKAGLDWNYCVTVMAGAKSCNGRFPQSSTAVANGRERKARSVVLVRSNRPATSHPSSGSHDLSHVFLQLLHFFPSLYKVSMHFPIPVMRSHVAQSLCWHECAKMEASSQSRGVVPSCAAPPTSPVSPVDCR